MILLPSAGGVLVEIVSGCYGSVKVGHVDGGNLSVFLGGACGYQKSRSHDEMEFFHILFCLNFLHLFPFGESICEGRKISSYLPQSGLPYIYAEASETIFHDRQ